MLYECTSHLSKNISTLGRFYTKDALSVWTNLGQHFVVRLVMRLKYKDAHKTHYVSKRTTFRSAGRCSRRIKEDSSSRQAYAWCVLCPSLYFTRITGRSTKCLPKSVRRIMWLYYKNGHWNYQEEDCFCKDIYRTLPIWSLIDNILKNRTGTCIKSTPGNILKPILRKYKTFKINLL